MIDSDKKIEEALSRFKANPWKSVRLYSVAFLLLAGVTGLGTLGQRVSYSRLAAIATPVRHLFSGAERPSSPETMSLGQLERRIDDLVANLVIREKSAHEVMDTIRNASLSVGYNIDALKKDLFYNRMIADPGWPCEVARYPAKTPDGWMCILTEEKSGHSPVVIVATTKQPLASFRKGDKVLVMGRCTSIAEMSVGLADADIRPVTK